MKLETCDNYERWAPPFQRVKLKVRTRCRFCDFKAKRTVCRRQQREGLNFNPRDPKNNPSPKMIPKGAEAIRIVTANGSSGTYYACMECAGQLLSNLQTEMEC